MAPTKSRAKAPLEERDTNLAQAKPNFSGDGKKTGKEVSNDKPPLKRSISETDPTDDIKDDEEDDDGTFEIKYDCDDIRRKIRAFLNSGEMKVTHWQRELGINSNSYSRFMKLKGPYSGIDNQTFEAAHRFFVKRDAKGIKTQRPKKAKTASKTSPLDEVKDITLDGEDTRSVPIYDSCDEIRRKINAAIRGGQTQAGLCKAFAAAWNDDRTIQSAQLQRFLKYKGATQGNSSGVYYGAYVYFEKLRIKEGKKKTKHREEMERIWAHQGGASTEQDKGGYLCIGNERPYMDQYGRVTFH